MSVLVIDIGGTTVKCLASGHRTPVQIPSGPRLTPRVLVNDVLAATAGWQYDRISIGYPGPVRGNKPAREPWNLGAGWTGFDFAKAFGRRVRVVNDASMQALGSYAGRKMLFLGLGTGLGTTLICDGVVIPMELAHLPYRDGQSYEDFLGVAGRERLGTHAWRKHTLKVIDLFMAAFLADYVVLGGGNAQNMGELPKYVRIGSNTNAFKGGFRLWSDTSSERTPESVPRR